MVYDASEVRDSVIAEVRRLLCDPHRQFAGTERLVRDLKLDSDDLSFLFVPSLERRFQVKPSLDESAEDGLGKSCCRNVGTFRSDRVEDFGMSPGTYVLQVEYVSPVPSEFAPWPGFWGRDRPAVNSNQVRVLITK